jgi:GTP-binding protein
LNKAFEVIKEEKVGTATAKKKGRPKLYYATQVAVNPVTILLFVNRPELFEENYRRFITNRLRTMLPIEEVPIRLLARPHRK